MYEGAATTVPDRRAEITPEQAAAELLSRDSAARSLHEFLRQAWPQIEKNRDFQDNWHLEAICAHLEAVTRGQVKNLLINVPPRMTKSTLVAVAWPAWCWITQPGLQFVFTSYAHPLSIRDSRRCRTLIRSRWYQARWGKRFQMLEDSDTKLRFDNSEFGYRIASSVDGSNTGEGGDIIVADDPNNVKDQSEVMLQSTLDWWTQVMPTRLNDFKTGRRVVIQQRCHELDLSGHIIGMKDEEWVHLMLPMEFEEKRRCTTVPLPSTRGKPWQDPRKEEGQLLDPKRIGPKELASLKKNLGGEYAVAGQLQQRPAPAEGGIIKKAWFKWWKHPVPPKIDYVIASWDTAMSEKKRAAFSACTVWGVFKDEKLIPNIILLNLWRGKVEYPELRRKVQDIAADYRNDDGKIKLEPGTAMLHKPNLNLMEMKANAISLRQDLSRAGILITGFDPTKHGDKLQRVRLVTHLIEGGRVWVPAQPHLYVTLRGYGDFLVEQCAGFPNAACRDVVDTMSQCLLRLSLSGWTTHPDDPEPPPREDYSERPALY